MNKRLEHCIQHHRSMIGFVVVLKLLEDPGNAPLGDVIHSCDVSEHSMLGIAPPAQNGILWGVSSRPGNTWGHHSTATCDSQQVRVSASLSSCVGTGRWTGELFNQPQPASFHWRPSSTLLTSQTKQRSTWADMGKACILAMETAPLSGDWTRVVSCKCALHHSREAFSGGSCILCVLRTAVTDHVQTILEHGIQAPKGSCGEELNKSNILSSEENKDYIKEILINNPVLHRKRKALIPLSSDWLTWKAQL